MHTAEHQATSDFQPSDEDLAEADEAAEILFPHDLEAAAWGEIDDAELMARVDFSEELHRYAENSGSPYFHLLADVVASPGIHAFAAWEAAYASWDVRAVLHGSVPPTSITDALRESTKAVRNTAPASDLETAWWLRIRSLVAAYAQVRRQFPRGGSRAWATFVELTAFHGGGRTGPTARRTPTEALLVAEARAEGCLVDF
ncbi:MAG TPA: hypothetical protein VNW53_11675 [Phenylobacterium sp.]|uniref:hypothetical protein n=1 Tax=Phenylobacterium sp. TaxID=1871053 RepID=UPI002CDC1B92|nr:hypothetical protein [Phenylobacterium sp.]HXA39652.1 hypothetical protein [Phenylobacterium sp.]